MATERDRITEELDGLSPEGASLLARLKREEPARAAGEREALRAAVLRRTARAPRRWPAYAAAAVLVTALAGAWFALRPQPEPCATLACLLDGLSDAELLELAAGTPGWGAATAWDEAWTATAERALAGGLSLDAADATDGGPLEDLPLDAWVDAAADQLTTEDLESAVPEGVDWDRFWSSEP
jgi:hypothetical protein